MSQQTQPRPTAVRGFAPAVPPSAISGDSAIEIVEYGTPHQRVIECVLKGATIAIADASAAIGNGNVKLCDLPEALTKLEALQLNLDRIARVGTGLNADADGDVAVGTTVGSGTLATTEANLLASTAIPQMVAGVTAVSAESVPAAPVLLDGTATATDLILNFAFDSGDASAADSIRVWGRVVLYYGAFIGPAENLAPVYVAS